MADFAADPYRGGRPPVPVPGDAIPLHAAAAGYVTHVDVDALARAARASALTVHVAAVPGTLVHADRPLLHVEGARPGEDLRETLVRAFTVERHRSFDHDQRLGLIALSEIASRALSPAVNDPGTAIEVLNAILRTLSHLPAERPGADAELPPVHVPRPSVAEMLGDAFLPILRDGAATGEVALRTLKILAVLETELPHAHAEVRHLAGRLRRAMHAAQDDPAVVETFDAAWARAF